MTDNWIKCSERMPEERKRILIYTENKNIIIGYVKNINTDDKSEYFVESSCFSWDGMTHWQPLPTTPPEDET